MLKVFFKQKKSLKEKEWWKQEHSSNFSFEQLLIIPLYKMVLFITYCWSFNFYGLFENRRIGFAMSILALSNFKVSS